MELQRLQNLGRLVRVPYRRERPKRPLWLLLPHKSRQKDSVRDNHGSPLHLLVGRRRVVLHDRLPEPLQQMNEE